MESTIDDSRLPDLVCVLLQVYEELGENADLWLGTELRKFTGDILSKLISESWGLIGALEHGAFSSCFHQARSVIELVSFYNWVVASEGKRQNRLRKYFAFMDLFVYQSMVKAESSPALMASMKRKGNYQSPSKWSDQLPGWAGLFGVKIDDLPKIKSWLHPATIQNTIEAAPGGDKLIIQYDLFSRITHVSPHTQIFAGPKVIGLPGDRTRSLEAVDELAVNTRAIWGVMLGLVHEHHGYNFKAKFPSFMGEPPSIGDS